VRRIALLIALASCAPTQPGAGTGAAARAPAKCAACHLAPQQGSLRAERWPRFLETHERRLRLTDADKALLHEFLVRPP
jgi:cytochrome c553